MIDFEVHTGVHVEEQTQLPDYCTCNACHRTFRPKSADPLGLELCSACLDALHHPERAIPTVHVKAVLRRS